MNTSNQPDKINGLTIARSIPLQGVQRVVAQRMMESQTTTASVTAMAEVDATVLLATYERLRKDIPELSVTHLLIQATARCLRRHSRINATMIDETIHELAEVNLSIALSLPSDDLYVVTLWDADKKSLQQLATELRMLRERVSKGKPGIRDVRGGTFTLSNYGMLRNVVWSTPIITPGQVGVLGVARIVPQLVPSPTGEGYVVRPTLPFSLTYDHRIINGIPAGRFLDDMATTLMTDDWIQLDGAYV